MLSYEASPSTGGILQEPAFQSTAGGRKPLGRDSLIVYKLAAGHPGRDIGKAGLSKLGYEGEVLFPPLTRYRIEDVVQKAREGPKRQLAGVGRAPSRPPPSRVRRPGWPKPALSHSGAPILPAASSTRVAAQRVSAAPNSRPDRSSRCHHPSRALRSGIGVR